MTFEELVKQVEQLTKEVAALKSDRRLLAREVDFEVLSPDAVVGIDYVAWRFGCDEKSVARWSFGTRVLRNQRICKKPSRWLKRVVDNAWREMTKPAAQKAADIIAVTATKPKRRKGMIRRNRN